MASVVSQPNEYPFKSMTDCFDVSVKVSERFVVSVGESKSVRRGDTVLLPCWLTPHQNAEDLVIRWYHEDHVDTPVMIYIPGKANRFFMDGSYVGRVSFDKKDSTSGGLKTGDVTLKLTNVTVRDDGKYTIFWIKASSSSSNLLTETGSLPVLSAVSKEDHTVNVSCESEGWFPQPEVRWSEDPDKDRVTFVRDSSGLIRVHSWILVSQKRNGESKKDEMTHLWEIELFILWTFFTFLNTLLIYHLGQNKH
uniref:Ig-like domain-containing protein n=1 Tax=Oryzias melastigma TaxID=30732 RepID=A0A3B3DAY5_ORYME